MGFSSFPILEKCLETFIFNLTKNQKCKKLQNDPSILCDCFYGPWSANFGCYNTISMKSIRHTADIIDKYYDKGSEILPSNSQKKEYDLIESEIYKIIID